MDSAQLLYNPLRGGGGRIQSRGIVFVVDKRGRNGTVCYDEKWGLEEVMVSIEYCSFLEKPYTYLEYKGTP